MSRFAVIDTETTWEDDVMSIGVVIADSGTFELIDKKYYILTPFNKHGAMYTSALYIVEPDLECTRNNVIDELISFILDHQIESIFAYNASFDHRHLPELKHLAWHDIMKIAAYRQHNCKISPHADCYGTGRLKSGYGVESIYRLLSEDMYCETHNALHDAIDELEIMRLLQHDLDIYSLAQIGVNNRISAAKRGGSNPYEGTKRKRMQNRTQK